MNTTDTTAARLLALFDGARALGLSAPSARDYAATMAVRLHLVPGLVAARDALAAALRQRTAQPVLDIMPG